MGAMEPTPLVVRPAGPSDVEAVAAFIRDLAEYEELAHECHVDPETLSGHLFGPHPVAEVLLAESAGVPVGFALFFPTYSTFLARPGIWLEDLFVAPEHRRGGVGRALLSAVAGVARHRECGRLEWSVLDWNRPAVDFYQGLGARLMDGWTTCRVEGDTLAALAAAPA